MFNLSAIGIFYLIAEGCLWLYTRKIKYSRLVRVFLIKCVGGSGYSVGIFYLEEKSGLEKIV